jgi:hypothetical protein
MLVLLLKPNLIDNIYIEKPLEIEFKCMSDHYKRVKKRQDNVFWTNEFGFVSGRELFSLKKNTLLSKLSLNHL